MDPTRCDLAKPRQLITAAPTHQEDSSEVICPCGYVLQRRDPVGGIVSQLALERRGWKRTVWTTFLYLKPV